MTQREVTPIRRGAPTPPLAHAIQQEIKSTVAQAIRNALQIVAANVVEGTDPEPWAQLDSDAIGGITRQLTGALQLLEEGQAPAVRFLTSNEARGRIAEGESPMISRPAADGVTCAECGEALKDHPVELPARRRICVAPMQRTGERAIPIADTGDQWPLARREP